MLDRALGRMDERRAVVYEKIRLALAARTPVLDAADDLESPDTGGTHYHRERRLVATPVERRRPLPDIILIRDCILFMALPYCTEREDGQVFATSSVLDYTSGGLPMARGSWIRGVLADVVQFRGALHHRQVVDSRGGSMSHLQ